MTFARHHLAALLLATPAIAGGDNTVTFEFGGYLDSVDESLAGVFAVGDPFFGSLTYDLDAPDQAESDTYGIYENVIALSCTINGTHSATATGGQCNFPIGAVLDFIVEDGFAGDPAAGMTPQFVNIPLSERAGDPLFDTDEMPGNPFPSMLDFSNARFRIRFGPTWNENEVEGRITLDGPPTPVAAATWGQVKAIFGR
jgi:hypothetical protein